MSNSVVVGLDGSAGGEKALAYAKAHVSAATACKIVVCYVIEWSPFSFQTAEENEQRHKRREEEIALAQERVVNPALKALSDAGFDAEGVVKHGDVASILEKVAKDKGASQIIVARKGDSSLKQRIFGSVTGNLVASSTLPVTVIPA